MPPHQPDLTTRQARVGHYRDEDAAELTDLLHRSYAELGSAGWNFTAVDQDIATTRRRATAGRCFIARAGTQIVGSVAMSMPPEPELQTLTDVACRPGTAWLTQLAVDPGYRHQGLAGRLWTIGQDWAVMVGATHIGVDTAEPAIHLAQIYERWGFTTVDTVQWPGKTYRFVVMTVPLAETSVAPGGV